MGSWRCIHCGHQVSERELPRPEGASSHPAEPRPTEIVCPSCGGDGLDFDEVFEGGLEEDDSVAMPDPLSQTEEDGPETVLDSSLLEEASPEDLWEAVHELPDEERHELPLPTPGDDAPLPELEFTSLPDDPDTEVPPVLEGEGVAPPLLPEDLPGVDFERETFQIPEEASSTEEGTLETLLEGAPDVPEEVWEDEEEVPEAGESPRPRGGP